MDRTKIAFVCSSGGHFLQLYTLSKALCAGREYAPFWVTFDKSDTRSMLAGERVFSGHYPTNRHLGNLFRNAALAFRLLKKERPAVVVSSGAGIAVPFLVLARLFGAKAVYIESFARQNQLSLTGKLVYYFVDRLYVQYESLASQYPKAIYRGSIY